MRNLWSGALLGATVFGLTGCITVEDAIRAAAMANGSQSSSSAPATPPPAAPAPEAAPAASNANSQWASPEALYGMFSMAFSNMGFMYGGTELKEGEYIRLGSQSAQSDSRQPAWFERARLKDGPNGQQWWRIKFAGEQNESIVVEGLYAPDQQKLVRMRAKLPGETAPREIPCDTLQQMPPRRSMSPQSVGAVEAGVESVTTQAGTFSAHHYTIQHGGDGLDWWISDTIPGGLVKMSGRTRGGSLELQAYGNNATTELGSF